MEVACLTSQEPKVSDASEVLTPDLTLPRRACQRAGLKQMLAFMIAHKNLSKIGVTATTSHLMTLKWSLLLFVFVVRMCVCVWGGGELG